MQQTSPEPRIVHPLQQGNYKLYLIFDNDLVDFTLCQNKQQNTIYSIFQSSELFSS